MDLKRRFSQKDVLAQMIPQIGVRHPDYGYFAAPPPDFLRPATMTPYMSVLGSQLRRRRSYQRLKWMERVDAVKAVYEKIAAFSEWYSEYDVMEYAKGQTAQVMVPLLHSDVDEGAPVGRTRSHVIRKPVIDDIVLQWGAFQRSAKSQATTKLPRDTNLGWPFPFSGRLGARPFVLGVIALMADAQKRRGVSLADTFGELRHSFGMPMMLLGHRTQTSGKPMPIIDGAGLLWTYNFQSRARTIRPAPKIGVVYNKFNVSWLLKCAMECPQHNQDRTFISKWMEDKGQVFDLVALDVSKFDKSHGGEYLERAAASFEKILGVKGLAADLMEEVKIPLTFSYGSSLFQTVTPVAPQLPSGISWTTVCGLFWGDYICRVALDMVGVSRSDMPNRYLNWGDDIVLALPRGTDQTRFVERLSTLLDLSFDIEPALKYLGMTYGSGAYEATKGYSAYRLISKIWLPEIVKTGPTAFIGYAARLQFIPRADEFHARFVASGWHEALGDPVSFSGVKDRLRQALEAVNNEPALYDYDELNFMLHGISPSEGASLLDELGVDFDFESFLGGIDLTDPKRYIEGEHPDLASSYRLALKEIALKGAPALYAFARQFAANEKLRLEGGVVF